MMAAPRCRPEPLPAERSCSSCEGCLARVQVRRCPQSGIAAPFTDFSVSSSASLPSAALRDGRDPVAAYLSPAAGSTLGDSAGAQEPARGRAAHVAALDRALPPPRRGDVARILHCASTACAELGGPAEAALRDRARLPADGPSVGPQRCAQLTGCGQGSLRNTPTHPRGGRGAQSRKGCGRTGTPFRRLMLWSHYSPSSRNESRNVVIQPEDDPSA